MDDLTTKYLHNAHHLVVQGNMFKNKAIAYSDKGELEGALINYMMSAQAINNASNQLKALGPTTPSIDAKLSELCAESCINLDKQLSETVARIVPLQEELRKRKLKYGCDTADSKAPCADIKNLVISGKDCLFFDNISGLGEAKKQIIDSLINSIVYPRLYPKKSKGILFYGPPGTGKTLLAKAAVNELQREGEGKIHVLFFAPTGAELKGKFVGETEKNIQKYFKCASEQASIVETEKNNKHVSDTTPAEKVISVIFIDEIDSIAGDREKDSSGLMANSVNSLLQQMDGISSIDNVSVMAATNYPYNLDDAVLRRFDTQIYIPLPDEIAIAQIIRLEFNKYIENVFSSHDNKSIKDASDPMSHKSSTIRADCPAGAQSFGPKNEICLATCEPQSSAMIYKLPEYKKYISLSDNDIKLISLTLKKQRFSASNVNTICKKVFLEVATSALHYGRFFKVLLKNPKAASKPDSESQLTVSGDAVTPQQPVTGAIAESANAPTSVTVVQLPPNTMELYMSNLCKPSDYKPDIGNMLFTKQPEYKSITIEGITYVPIEDMYDDIYIDDIEADAIYCKTIDRISESTLPIELLIKQKVYIETSDDTVPGYSENMIAKYVYIKTVVVKADINKNWWTRAKEVLITQPVTVSVDHVTKINKIGHSMLLANAKELYCFKKESTGYKCESITVDFTGGLHELESMILDIIRNNYAVFKRNNQTICIRSLQPEADILNTDFTFLDYFKNVKQLFPITGKTLIGTAKACPNFSPGDRINKTDNTWTNLFTIKSIPCELTEFTLTPLEQQSITNKIKDNRKKLISFNVKKEQFIELSRPDNPMGVKNNTPIEKITSLNQYSMGTYKKPA